MNQIILVWLFDRRGPRGNYRFAGGIIVKTKLYGSVGQIVFSVQHGKNLDDEENTCKFSTMRSLVLTIAWNRAGCFNSLTCSCTMKYSRGSAPAMFFRAVADSNDMAVTDGAHERVEIGCNSD